MLIKLKDNQKSIKSYQEALKIFRDLPSIDSKHMERALTGLGDATYFQRGINELERKRKGLKYAEEALIWHYKHVPENNINTAYLIENLELLYRFLGDEIKSLEYKKQAYSIFLSLGAWVFSSRFSHQKLI